MGKFQYLTWFVIYEDCSVPGLILLLLLFLTTVYHTNSNKLADSPESIYAEKLVRLHKKLQQVKDNNFEPVRFIQPVQGAEDR